jgi:sulfur-oxidizing protein SoxY
MCIRAAAAIAFAIMILSSSAGPSLADDPEESWREIANNAFNGRPLTDGSQFIMLEMPSRADDAAVVPVTMRVNLPAGDARTLRSITLVIDENPSPVAATFNVDSSVAIISTRVRVNSNTKVHAVAELSDGNLYFVETYVKASGGCSAPMASNGEDIAAKLGELRFRQFGKTAAQAASSTREAQIMIRHPNNSGLQRDQTSLLYIPLFIVRQLRVLQGDQLILEMDGGISISENPNIRFSYRPNGASRFRVEAVDTEGHVYRGEWPVEPAT